MAELVVISAVYLAGNIACLIFLLMFCYCCDKWSGEQEDGEDDC